MDMEIKDLAVNMIDRFINQDTDRYGRVTRKESQFNNTVDLLFNIKTVAIDDNYIIMEFPNNSVCAINCQSFNYHKIEVL